MNLPNGSQCNFTINFQRNLLNPGYFFNIWAERTEISNVVIDDKLIQEAFRLLKRYLDTQTYYDLKNGKESYAEAARMYLELRKKGMTVKSTADCLIARVALENELFLLHNDADFDRIAEHFPLKIWNAEV